MNVLFENIDITSNMVLVSACLFVFGLGLKASPKIPNYLIIWILMILGISLEFLVDGLAVESFLSGIIATGMAVLTHQTVKQTKEGISIRKNN